MQIVRGLYTKKTCMKLSVFGLETSINPSHMLVLDRRYHFVICMSMPLLRVINFSELKDLLSF